MERSIVTAVVGGIGLALCLFIIKQPAPAEVVIQAAPELLESVEPKNTQTEERVEEDDDPTVGWITIHEDKADWGVSDTDLIHFICPRPEWFPYSTFRGPPVPASTAGLDPSGYVLRTSQGVRLHRDGWVVTVDGRAYRAEELDEQS